MKIKLHFILILLLLISPSLKAEMERSDEIKIELRSLADTKDGEQKLNDSFKRGSTLWINLKALGLKKTADQEFDVEVDFVMSPGGIRKKSVIDQGKIIDKKVPAKGTEELLLYFTIQLSKNLKMGPYLVEINVKDRVAGKFTVYTISFNVMP